VSGPVPDGGSPVVVCPSCDGLGFAVVACRCTDGGDRLLVTDGMDRPAGEPYRDCLLCQGDGAVGEPCHDCGQTGRRRAQLVLTMANLDTGAVASANVVPGVVEPVPWPGDGGESWYLPLGPLLRDLAAVVGVESWTDARQPGSPDRAAGAAAARLAPGVAGGGPPGGGGGGAGGGVVGRLAGVPGAWQARPGP